MRNAQEADGTWNFTHSHQHRLGMTALAGLALMENGIAADDPAILAAKQAVEHLAVTSNQTYDLALAILFLARQGPARKGSSDEVLPPGVPAGGGRSGRMLDLQRTDEERAAGEDIGPRSDVAASRRAASARSPDRTGTATIRTPSSHLLGLWAAGRNAFDADLALESIDRHFRSTQQSDGGWGYRQGTPGSHAMSCAGLMGLAMAAARPGLAERQTARSRGAALAADPAFQAALQAVSRDARTINEHSDIYYLWSLERVCVALGLRLLDGFDWYAAGARILLDQQQPDGSLAARPVGGVSEHLPCRCSSSARPTSPSSSTACSAFPGRPSPWRRLARGAATVTVGNRRRTRSGAAGRARMIPGPGAELRENTVVVTGASQQAFPRIAVQFEVRRPDGSFLVDATRAGFPGHRGGQGGAVCSTFRHPRRTEAIPTTIVLVVDRSLSMEEEDRIGSLKQAVSSFLEKLPEGSRIAVVAFGSEVARICPFTTDREQVRSAVSRLRPGGATRFYDAVAEALELLDRETGRRAVLALTDGEDTFSQSADLDSSIASAAEARPAGLHPRPGDRGGDRERRPEADGHLDPRPVLPGPQRRTSSGRSTRPSPPASAPATPWSTRATAASPTAPSAPSSSSTAAAARPAETAVFIPGMVVPAAGWSTLFLFLIVLLTGLACLPAWLRRRAAGPA